MSGDIGQLAQQMGTQLPAGVAETPPPVGPIGGMVQAQQPVAPTQVSTAINPAAPQPIGGK